MPVNFIQPTFAAGEIAPSLYARVDLAKYHAACKLLRNFFVWAHGGVSNRAGTMFVGRCWNSAYPVHLIPFQFNLVQTYILEFGHLYMRVIMNGGYVLEPSLPIFTMGNGNPCGITITGNYPPLNSGDQVFIAGTGTSLDSTPAKQYLAQYVRAAPIADGPPNYEYFYTLADLDGNPIDSTNYGAYGGGGTVARVFTLTTPYDGNDVQAIKWTQSADVLTLCHPNYPPCDLERTEHWDWTLNPISFAPQISAPASVTATPGTSGSWNFAYVVTALSDAPPEESLASQVAACAGVALNLTTGASNVISWGKITTANRYYIYKANPSKSAILAGAMFGYIGQTTGTSFEDMEIAPDFSRAPPQGTNPFNSGPITTVAVINGGSGYSSDIQLTVNDVTGTGAVLTPTVVGGVITAVTITSPGQNYQEPVVNAANQGSGAVGHINVMHVLGQYIVSATVTKGGQDYYGATSAVPASGGTGCTFTPIVTNGVITSVHVSGTGSGYTDGDALVFGQKAGTGATFSVSVTPSGNYPSCATYFQQRKVFAGSLQQPQTIWMTQPADYKNMDVSNPSKASDAIVLSIAANQVNAIKWLVPMNNLLVMTSAGAWALMGGYLTQPVAVTPTNSVVVPQSYTGCADLPPIVINYDVLYVQAKGSIVRDLAYNFYAQVYTGTDMSILSNHLFFGHNLERWAYAEQPFYQVWAVRDDGMLLSFTYLKEQDVYAWAHHDSPGNSGTDLFLSVASIPEQQIPGINIDSVYFVVQRTIPGINGGNPVKYVERMTSRNFLTNGAADVTKTWFVDCGLQYNGYAINPSTGLPYGPATVISGLDHLNGATVSILADGSVQPQQVVAGGCITLPQAASLVTVGLPYVAQMQTLCMEPEGMVMQVQDYRKRISAVALRVTDTRGLKVGPKFTDMVEIKERSSAVSMGAAIPLFTGDQRVVIDNNYLVDDDVCIEQDNPLPCTILGVIPEVSIGDSPG
ncbi:MAG: hypothetical protein ABSG91_06230 [Syntrophobacteraceae bacterium]|jgi:hypothetical protein